MKAHVGVDVDSSTVHTLEATTAKVHDSRVWDELLHGEEKWVWADKGYISAEREAAFSKEGKVWGVMRKAPKGGKLDPIDEEINRIIAKARQGRTSLPGDQATVWSHENAVSRSGKEPGASVHPIRAWQPVPGATKASRMRMSLSETAISAARAAQTARKSMETATAWPYSALKRQYQSSRGR